MPCPKNLTVRTVVGAVVVQEVEEGAGQLGTGSGSVAFVLSFSLLWSAGRGIAFFFPFPSEGRYLRTSLYLKFP